MMQGRALIWAPISYHMPGKRARERRPGTDPSGLHKALSLPPVASTSPVSLPLTLIPPWPPSRPPSPSSSRSSTPCCSQVSPTAFNPPGEATYGLNAPSRAGMNVAAGPELAAAVTNAGGLGVIGGVGYTPKILRAQVSTLVSRKPAESTRADDICLRRSRPSRTTLWTRARPLAWICCCRRSEATRARRT